ncbi:uncharacterized protein LOC133285118 [Gastrolobium bilobum]|uniref:uncharacterized protein LOC133285118 n=1 Tax=Gastrolobium bilobum TaxID=150636 RepID=UPI002AB1A2A0|nr:uncharacterized protein LOC133285118 [Gastrolobium bilobum]
MARLKSEITAFEQKDSESLYEAWERFKGLLRKRPQHGIEAWEKARIFFQGMTSSTRTLVNAATGGSLKSKTPEEALELLESLASQEFDNALAPVAPRRSGIMKLEDYDEAYATEDCEYIRNTEKQPAEVNALWYDQKNSNNPGRNQYGNQGWKNNNQHPGLSYKSNYQLNPPMPLQQQPQGTTLEWEKAFAQLPKTTSGFIQNADAFRNETRASFWNQEASIRNLETQIGQLSRHFTERTQGTFPSNTVVNPREHCNAITTRSGTMIQPVEKPPVEKKKEAEPEVEKEKEEDAVEAEKCIPEKKLFKWEKNKALDRQPKAADPSPYTKVPYPQRSKQEHHVMPLSMMKNLGITEVKPTKTIVQLADRSSKQAYGIIEDILVKVDKFIIPVDFVILDIEEDATIPMIFGRPFLATSGALIDVLKGELILRVDGEQATFKFFDKEVPPSVAQPEDKSTILVKKR